MTTKQSTIEAIKTLCLDITEKATMINFNLYDTEIAGIDRNDTMKIILAVNEIMKKLNNHING